MSVESDPLRTEELHPVGNRTIVEGLTFDDVLLVPGRSERSSNRCINAHAHHAADYAQCAPGLGGNGHRHRGPGWPITLARAGPGFGVIHRNLGLEDQALEVDKVKRSQSGMIVDPITLPPTATVGEANEVMARVPHLGACRSPIRAGSWSASSPTAICVSAATTSMQVADLSDDGAPGHRAGRHHAGTGRGAAASAPHREAPGRGRPAASCADSSRSRTLPSARSFPAPVYDASGRLVVAGAIGTHNEGLPRARELVAAGGRRRGGGTPRTDTTAPSSIPCAKSKASLDVDVIRGQRGNRGGAPAR